MCQRLFITFFLLFQIISHAQNLTSIDVSAELKENADAVIKKLEEKLEIKKFNLYAYQISKEIVIYNEKGYEKCMPYLNYYDENQIKRLEVKIYNNYGIEIKKFKKNDFKDVATNDGFSIQSDGRVKYIDYTPINYPFIIQFDYSYESSDTAFLQRWAPFENYGVAIENATFELIVQPDIKCNVLEKNFENFQIEKKNVGTTILYQLHNLKALKWENNSLPNHKFFPIAYFSLNHFSLKGVEGNANNWEELGKWFYEALYKTQFELPESTIQKIRQLTSNAKTDEEKAKIVYKYVQDKTRYVSIQLGIGGWQPMKAADVDRLGYGDCKGLTNYTFALLKAVGINAYHTIISNDEDKKDFITEMPFLQGNHMILCIPGKENIWLECTSQKSAFGEIGSSNEDRKVLVVTPEGGKIERTKKYDEKENIIFTKAKVQLDSDGEMKANLDKVFNGITVERRFALENKTESERKDFYREVWDYYNPIVIKEFSTKRNNEAKTWEEKFDLEVEKFALKNANQLIVNANPFSRWENIPDKIRTRKQPVNIKRGFTEVDEIEFLLPENSKIEALPQNTMLETKFGTYQFDITVNEHKIVYKRKFTLFEAQHSNTDYNDFRIFLIEVNKFDNAKFLIQLN